MTCLAGIDLWIALGSAAFIGAAGMFGGLLWGALAHQSTCDRPEE